MTTKIQKLIKKIINALIKHLSYWRESYVFFPAVVGLLYLVIASVHYYTGQPIQQDPNNLIGGFYNFIFAALAVIATGATKPHLYDDIDTKTPNTPLGRCILDSLETTFLLLFFAYCIFKSFSFN